MAPIFVGEGNGTSTIGTTDGGATWHTQSLGIGGDADDTDLSCPTPSTCMVATISPNPHFLGTVARTTDGGATWQTEAGAPAADFDSVSCPTASDCFLLGHFFDGATDVPVVDATTDGGTTWTSEDLPATPSPSRLMSLSCPTSSDCWVAVVSEVDASTDGGHSWVAESLPPAVGSTQGITVRGALLVLGSGRDGDRCRDPGPAPSCHDGPRQARTCTRPRPCRPVRTRSSP